MKKSTIISILIASGKSDILERALEIDKGIKPSIPKTILVNIYKENLPSGFEFSNNKLGYITKPLAVIEYNPYRMTDCYLVEYPDGKKVWKDTASWYKESNEEIVPINTIEDLPPSENPFNDNELKETQSDLN